MPDQLTLTGVVATSPRHLKTSTGLDITTFRLASSQRRFDRAQQKWVDADTNWYTISGFRQLAVNLVASLTKGQHVVVTGRLRVREWKDGERSGINVEVDADAVGHDLSWGTTAFTRVPHDARGSADDGAETAGRDGADSAPGAASEDGGWAVADVPAEREPEAAIPF